MNSAIGQSIDRVDGPLKVTGAARYSAEIALPNMAYAAVVTSTVPSAQITAIDTAAASAADGVLAVLTHNDLPKVSQPPLVPSLFGIAAPGETFFPMQDEIVHYAGQPVALVVADGHERAQFAASMIRVSYDERVLGDNDRTGARAGVRAESDLRRLHARALQPRRRRQGAR